MCRESPVSFRRPQRDRLVTERFSHPDPATFKPHHAVTVDLADDIARSVFDCPQALWKRTRAYLVARQLRHQPESLVVTAMAVDLTPAIEGALTGRQIAEASGVQ